MIISASRRTDIPAFYSEWFLNRISEGFLLVRNPMNAHQVSRINLSPKVVDFIVFWTKNPARMSKSLDRLKLFSFYFQYTLNPYGKELEPNIPGQDESIKTFISLSDRVGSKRVIWRYDPIILSDKYDVAYHLKSFEGMSHKLAGKTNRVVISFLDLYKKIQKNFSPMRLEDTQENMLEVAKRFHEMANYNNIRMEVVSCAEIIDLHKNGIEHGKCIDDKLIEEISGYQLEVEKDKTQRKECGCVASIDIGAYNTCPHGCLYCYANFSAASVKSNYGHHNPKSPLLYGELSAKDKITDRHMISCRVMQQKLLY